ncbi:MAG TPA: HAD family hydrolase [Acidimicrobiales bacterium]|nr:HAD family hydrolase [Acidimicrobiales bacterium]
MIEAVLFDGDQTLWDFEKVMREALRAVRGEIAAARPCAFTAALTWQDLEADRDAVGWELDGIEYDLTRLRVLGFARTLERMRDAEGGAAAVDANAEADAELAAVIAASYFAHRDRDPALFDDTRACLDALRHRYRLGLLSNGSRSLATVGLDGVFECVVYAQDHRVAKPDKGIFEVAERQLGLDPAACVLVGDHPLNDVIGAKRAGWHAVWLDREGQGADAFLRLHPAEERPDAVVSSLADLPDALATLEAGP